MLKTTKKNEIKTKKNEKYLYENFKIEIYFEHEKICIT